MVLHFLRENKLYTKLSKCIFNKNKIHYFGNIISVDGIVVDLENIMAIKGCPVSRNVTKVRSFTGLVGYYRRFIKGFLNIASPITYLQKKGVKFEWTPKYEEIFQKVKDIMTIPSILKIS
jgi:hypothetical protein